MKKVPIYPWVLPALLITGLLFFMACNGTKTTDNTTNQTNQTDVNANQAITPQVEVPALFSAAASITEENEREMFDEELVQITVFESNVPMADNKKLVQKLFPNGKVTSAETSENIDAFNIIDAKKTYNVIVLYEQNDHEEYIIGFLMVSEGDFNIETVGKIFN